MAFNQEIIMTHDGSPMMGGVMMEGTWFNRLTGDSFTVMDSYFEDNNFRVRTTDNRVLDYNTFQDYMQVDPKELPALKAEYDREHNAPARDPLSQPVKPSTTTGTTTAPDDYASLLAEDPVLGSGIVPPADALNRPVVPSPRPTTVPNEPVNTYTNPNVVLIDKALRHQSIPTVKVSFDWDTFPKKQIEALTDVIDVPVSDIVDYLYYETIETALPEIEQSLKEYIRSKIKS